MTYHTMILSEPDNTHNGFIRRYYATIDISMPSTQWMWQQVDANGQPFGVVSQTFASEEEAKRDALSKLNGDCWE
ncbi:MAG: hypothetical protein WCL34_10320 [Methylococcaceae bacterium]